MKRSEKTRYRRTLEAKRAELSAGLRSRDGIAVREAADSLDQIQYAGERDLAIGTLDRDTRMLQRVRDALFRLRDGSYGVCLECGAAISSKRLEAAPWAACCVPCQEQADRAAASGGVEEWRGWPAPAM